MGDIDQTRESVATRHLYNFDRSHANYHDTKETIQSSGICWSHSETNQFNLVTRVKTPYHTLKSLSNMLLKITTETFVSLGEKW